MLFLGRRIVLLIFLVAIAFVLGCTGNAVKNSEKEGIFDSNLTETYSSTAVEFVKISTPFDDLKHLCNNQNLPCGIGTGTSTDKRMALMEAIAHARHNLAQEIESSISVIKSNNTKEIELNVKLDLEGSYVFETVTKFDKVSEKYNAYVLVLRDFAKIKPVIIAEYLSTKIEELEDKFSRKDSSSFKVRKGISESKQIACIESVEDVRDETIKQNICSILSRLEDYANNVSEGCEISRIHTTSNSLLTSRDNLDNFSLKTNVVFEHGKVEGSYDFRSIHESNYMAINDINDEGEFSFYSRMDISVYGKVEGTDVFIGGYLKEIGTNSNEVGDRVSLIEIYGEEKDVYMFKTSVKFNKEFQKYEILSYIWNAQK
jgi:hypothetical protein